MGVVVVVLAAGDGKRFGGPKALARAGGVTFVERVTATAIEAGAERTIVVTGRSHDEVTQVLAGAGATVLLARNPDPDRGQLSSLLVGLAHVGDADALLAWPVDLPFVRVGSVRRVIDAGRDHPGAIVIPEEGGRGGHPTLVPRDLFEELAALPLDQGLRALFTRRPERVLRIGVSDAAIHRDIDTREDLAALTG